MKNFNEIYEKVYKECSEPLEQLRKKSRNGIILAVFVSIFVGLILTIITKNTTMIFVAVIISAFFQIFSKSGKKYKTVFKEKIIKSFVKEYSQKLEFYPTRGISPMKYDQAKFEFYERYHSEDLITGTLEGEYRISMAEVKTETESRDSDGNTTTYTVFHGLFAEIELNKNLNSCIRIRKNGISLFNKKDKLEMDSGEFEKKFNVYSTDKIIAMQLLTSDIMQMLLDFKEENKITPEMTIEGNRFYIRFATGGVFEAKLMKKALDYDILKRYYNLINFTLDLTEKFLNNINETEV